MKRCSSLLIIGLALVLFVATAGPAAAYTLNANMAGTGSGTLTASGNVSSFSCIGKTCTVSVDNTETATLTATPSTGSTFTSWTGCDSTSGTGGNVCTVSVTTVSPVTATFTLIPETLTVNALGNGTGTLSSSTGGVNYTHPPTNAASVQINYGTPVTITAVAATGTSVAWTGNCDSTGGTTMNATCTINSMNSAKTVTATFTLSETLTVNASGNGTGTLSSSTGGVNYTHPPTNTASEQITFGTPVTITAVAATGTSVAWTGNCDSTGGTTMNATCTINSMNSAKTVAAQFTLTTKIGVFRNGSWYLDLNGNGVWNGGTDGAYVYGISTDIPVVGDWTGTGTSKIGVFRNGIWYLDLNGDHAWETTDGTYAYGVSTDIPVAGDWSGSGTSKIGVFRSGTWYLNYSGTGAWVGCGTPGDLTKDACFNYGVAGDIPVVGDWSGSGTSKIGVFRSGTWYLDFPGNGTWVGCGITPTTNRCYSFGATGDVPVVGDWTGNGIAKIGVFRPSTATWYLDLPGTGAWIGCGAPGDLTKDACFNSFGISTDIPVSGSW